MNMLNWMGMGAVGCLLALAPKASADMELTLTSGATTISVNDSGHPGVVVFDGSVGNWDLNVTTGVASGSDPIIELNSVDYILGSGTGANALSISLSADNLSGPVSGFNAAIGGTLAGGTSLTYQAYVDSSNSLNGMATEIGSMLSFGPFGSGGGAFSGATSGGSVNSSLYSATEVVDLSGSGSGPGLGSGSSFDASISAPEPIAAILLGSILVLTTSALRRKRARV